MNKLFCLFVLMISLLAYACKRKVYSECNSERFRTHLYISNLMVKDSAVDANVEIDDSLVFNAHVMRSQSRNKNNVSVNLCKGEHQFNIRFGSFKKDTVILVDKSSLVFIDMYYLKGNPLILTPNGIMISLVNTNGDSASSK